TGSRTRCSPRRSPSTAESGSKNSVPGNKLRKMDAACTGCGEEVEARFRFCPWCGAAQRRKLVEFFWPHPNSAGRALRVSRYFGDEPQVRFSVWDDGVARAAVSLDEDEARRLADFVAQSESGVRHRSAVSDIERTAQTL